MMVMEDFMLMAMAYCYVWEVEECVISVECKTGKGRGW
jgi:hypothetical protein